MRPYMMDTNTASSIFKGRSEAARRRMENLKDSDRICLSSITEAELLFGLSKRGNPTRLAAAMNLMLEDFEVLCWGRTEAAIYGDLRKNQEALGKPLGSLDMLIAAHALATGSVLVTSDKAFGHVRGLQVENWATDL